ncbi:MAG TPA: hypothetical protein VKG63_06470 [Steroidobacteraceae bacterium]|nr:hypothetical protein [Steroidobacteraceae bacterium]
MHRLVLFAILLGWVASCDAQVRGGIAEVAIVDRESGARLSAYYYRGEYWVAGRPGARYSIEIRNRLGERMLAVTSVDGVNVISGATAAWDQTGYVFNPGERYQISGWRKSDAEVADFTFTDSANSYAERTGRPANVGIIGVAIFRERPQQPAYAPPTIGQWPGRPEAPRASEFASAQPDESMAKAPAAAASNSAPTADARMSQALPAPMSSPMARAVPEPAPKLGTGHGEREYSYVNYTEFLRLQTQPNEVIRIHYDSLENLFAMGIVRRPRPLPPSPNPFPASPEQQYVPDPRG